MKRKVASLRLTTLILAVSFLLHALSNSLAHGHQANEVGCSEATILKKNLVFTRKELVGNNLTKGKKNAIGGRKLNLGHEEDQEHDQTVTSTLSGATKVEQTGVFEVKRDPFGGDDHSSMKLNEAFSATDYRGPRSHPAKHH